MLCSIASWGRAVLEYALALILRRHMQDSSFIIQVDVVACSITCTHNVPMCTSVAHICAQGGTIYCKSAARCARTKFLSIQLRSGLGKIGHDG